MRWQPACSITLGRVTRCSYAHVVVYQIDENLLPPERSAVKKVDKVIIIIR